jgi:DNA-directed RNA polymerase sigma subunit (sigma70/sigma32)
VWRSRPQRPRPWVGRYGIGGAHQQTLAQLGREPRVAEERVREIESWDREKLRRIAFEQMLDSAFD